MYSVCRALPTHDQNDACVAGLMGAVADGRIAGLTARAIGLPLSVDKDGTLREGTMVIPEVGALATDRISSALGALTGSEEVWACGRSYIRLNSAWRARVSEQRLYLPG